MNKIITDWNDYPFLLKIQYLIDLEIKDFNKRYGSNEFFNFLEKINDFLKSSIEESIPNPKNLEILFSIHLVSNYWKNTNQLKFTNNNFLEKQNLLIIEFWELINELDKIPSLYLSHNIEIKPKISKNEKNLVKNFQINKKILILLNLESNIMDYKKYNRNLDFFYFKVLDMVNIEKKIKAIYNYVYEDKVFAFNEEKIKNKDAYIDRWYLYFNVLISILLNLFDINFYFDAYKFIFPEKVNLIKNSKEFINFISNENSFVKKEIIKEIIDLIEKKIQNIFEIKNVNIKYPEKGKVNKKGLKKLLTHNNIYEFIPRCYGVIINYVLFDNNKMGLRNRISHINEISNNEIKSYEFFLLILLARDIKVINNYWNTY